MRLIIDPGHGGLDSGAVGPTGLKEKDVNLAVAKKLANYLLSVAEVKLTRDCDRQLGSDENTDLRARVNIAEDWQADYFISVHCNAGGSSAKGVETYAYKPGGKGEKLAKAIQAELVKATGLVDRGVKFANYYVLRKTSMPAVLVELAFISNPVEEKLLKDPAWQDKVARAIAQGVAGFLGINLKGGTQVAKVPEWKINAVKEGLAEGLINSNHDPEEKVDMGTLLAVCLNLLKKVREEK